MKMDPRVSLTWLLLLSATFLPDPGSAAVESSQTDSGTQSRNSLWKKLEEWLKGLFNPRASTPAPTSSPTTAEASSAPGIWTTLGEAPEITTTTDKGYSLAPTSITEESKAPEILTTTQRASEDTEELHISPTPLTSDSGTSAPETLSTAAETSTDHFATDRFCVSGSTELLTAPAPPSTPIEALSTLTDTFSDSVDTAWTKTTIDGTPAVITTPEPDVNTSPAEHVTPEAEVLIGPTTVENPARAETDPAPDSRANPVSLSQHLRMEVLEFLTSLCGRRRPGMQSIQLQQCVMLPTCRNYHSRDKRIIKFDFRGSVPSRVCLHCNVLACNRHNYPPQRYQGQRTRHGASERVIIRITPV